MHEPIYVEVGHMLAEGRLTATGRLVARLVHALARLTPLRLVSTVEPGAAKRLKLAPDGLGGREIAVSGADLPDADGDLTSWARRVARLPRMRHDRALAARCSGLFTGFRPTERHFRREVCLLSDLTPVILPWAYSAEERATVTDFLGESGNVCDKAVALSASGRADARWLSDIPPDDVVVARPGPSLCARSHACVKPVERRDQAILAVSALEPRDNNMFLLSWFLDTSVLAGKAELWWVGPAEWKDLGDQLTNLGPRLKEGRARGRTVHFLGSVRDSRLCRLYRKASCSIVPSLYEGFGFQALDALHHGTPVAAGFHSALQEMGGPGLFFFDPYDAGSLDAAYREMMRAAPTGIGDLRRRDLEENYSWDSLARTVLSLCA